MAEANPFDEFFADEKKKDIDHAIGDCLGIKLGPSEYSEQEAAEDAKILRKAMKGLGTTEKDIVKVAGTRNHSQRLMIKKAFVTIDQALYGKGKDRNLIKDLKSELSGNLENCIVPLFMDKGVYDAYLIKKACDGMGCDEDLITEVLCTRNNVELQQMQFVWTNVLGEKKSMNERIANETKNMVGNNNYQALMLGLLEADRPKINDVDEKQVKQDTEELNRFISQAQKKEAKDKFVKIFLTRSWPHLIEINKLFMTITKKYTLSGAIDKTFGDSNTGKALLTITEFCSQPYDYFAKKLVKSMKGLGTKDKDLIRIIVSRHNIDLDKIQEAFGLRHGNGKTLLNWIEGDTGGHYRQILKLLCGFD